MIVNYEIVDINILNKLLYTNHKDIDEEMKSKLKSYKSKIREGKVKVCYEYSNPLSIGRQYAKSISLQNIKKSIRHTLADDYYYDIDFINSGANILKQYCEKKSIICNKLIEYVENREKILKAICKVHKIDRSSAKNFMTRQITLGSYDIKGDAPGTRYINEFRKEIAKIADEIYKLDENKEIVGLVKEDKDKKNKKGSVISSVIFKIENECLMATREYFIEKSFIPGPLCFDGIMIEKNDNIVDDNILKECEEFVYKKTQYRVNLLIKPMDDKIDISMITYPYVTNDKEAQERIFELYGREKFKFCNNVLYIFNDSNGLYEECNNDLVPLTRILSSYSHVLFLESKNDKSQQKSYGKDSTLISKVIPFIKSESTNKKWLSRTDESSLGYLLFKNGIYDMKKDEFIPEFNEKIVFHESIDYNFPKRNQKYIDYARKLTFELYSDNYMPLLVSLARSLAGDRSNKSFYFCPGESNTGKSYLVNIFQKCFEGYIGTFNCENLTYKKNDSGDEAAAHRWAYSLRYKRIIFSNECNMEKSLNSNAIKKFSSGGDTIIGRIHYGLETEFRPHFHIFCMLNDIPKITPIDDAIKNRLQFFSFNRKFVSDPKKGQNKIDPNIDEKINSKKFRDGFVHLILDAYKYYLENGQPEFNEELKEEWTGNGYSDPKSPEGIKQRILENYEITENDNDKIRVTTIKEFLCKEGHISGPNIDKVLLSLGATKQRFKSIWYWFKIKQIKNNIEFIDE